ncbi:MAG: sensor domain-containing diguanylate cyclase [Novosphingobium sp.]
MIRFPKVSVDQRHLLVIGICSLSAMALMALCIAALIGHVVLLGEPSDGATAAAMTFAGTALVLELFISVYGRREFQSHAKLLEHATGAKTQTDELFAMTDMLQSADDHSDATAVLMASTKRLLPEFGAALYIYNNSRDRLDLAGSINMPADYEPAESLHPANCWALKRGKPHINDPFSNTLCCAHHGSTVGTVEIPMMARESVYGLFVLAYDGDIAFDRLLAVRRLARALADSMSLALSNISLREKLRTQSLRDPLTGLYNRRYMEDALERYLSLAERVGGATSVVMLDLDYFKQLNDEHGHAKGDAVLRDVAAQLVGGLRPSDVVCRYGGEEFLIILPNCPLEDAAAKAEQLRERVESLAEAHGARISASFGIASVPATATSAAEVIPQSDAALYRAKRDGKNRVQCADRRSTREDSAPRLAVTG